MALATPSPSRFPSLRGVAPPVLEAPGFGERERAVHVGLEIARVVDEAERGGEGELVAADHVSSAELQAVDAEVFRRGIDQPLDHERRFRPPGAAIGRGRLAVAQRAPDLDMGRGRPVDAGERAQIVHRRTRAERREIGADIDHGSDAEADEAVISVERQLRIGDVVAPVIVAQMAFRAFAHPADRTPEPARRPQRQQIFRIDVGLDPEAAADIVDLDMDALLVDPEHPVGENRADDEGVLHRRAQEEAARAGIVAGETTARLHRVGEHAGQDESTPDHIARAREGGVGRRAVADLVDEAFVVRAAVEHDRRAVLQQVGGPGDRRERFVVDRHDLGGVLRPV